MRPQMLLLVVTLAATAMSANGAAAQSRSDEASASRQLVFVPESKGSLVLEAPSTLDFVRQSEANGETHIANAGFWSGVKKAAKGVAGTVKKVAGAAKKTVGAATTVAKKGIGTVKKVAGTAKNVGKGVINVAKKGVKKVVSPVTNSPVAKAAKKIAQKIGTKIGKKITERL